MHTLTSQVPQLIMPKCFHYIQEILDARPNSFSMICCRALNLSIDAIKSHHFLEMKASHHVFNTKSYFN